MRRKSINSVKGNEILAKDIYSNTDTILMASGMVLKKEYIEKLKQLNVNYVYVEDNFPVEQMDSETVEKRIHEQCQTAIRTVYDKFSYYGNVELKELSDVAYKVIVEVLKEPNVLYSVECVRQKQESLYMHCLNVCALAVLVGLKMKLPRASIDDIAIGSVLHDIGYLYIDIPYLSNGLIKQQDIDMQAIKKHVIYGYTEVENEVWLSKKAKNIILSHHEFIDGSGYPLKLSADDLDIETKIVTVCDQFDSLIYGNMVAQMKNHEAIEYIISQAGTKFDSNVVDAFKYSVAAYPNGSQVITSDGDIAVVIDQNVDFPTRPIIKLLKNSEGIPYNPSVVKNLVSELSLFIDDIIE
mgnify:CR=1 FL=1